MDFRVVPVGGTRVPCVSAVGSGNKICTNFYDVARQGNVLHICINFVTRNIDLIKVSLGESLFGEMISLL